MGRFGSSQGRILGGGSGSQGRDLPRYSCSPLTGWAASRIAARWGVAPFPSGGVWHVPRLWSKLSGT